MYKKLITVIVVLLCGLQSNLLYARWLNVADAPTSTSYTKTIDIHADGTYESIVEMKREIITEYGRDYNANVTLYYNGDSEKIEILEAKTLYHGKEYPVAKKSIEDKPLASSYHGFDQTRQILLAFPHVEKGAILYVKYKFLLRETVLPNFFAMFTYFGADELLTAAQIKIKSKLPLYTKINDPHGALKVVKEKGSGVYNLEFILTKPIINIVINEPFSLIPQKDLTWVSLSTLNNWQDFAMQLNKLWEVVLQQRLPETFKMILKEAQQRKNATSQINAVTLLLADKVRYMGNWRSIKGRFVPRNLREISKTQFGDCKDFSVVTAAILAKLGFKTQVAFVRRGISDVSLDVLPGVYAFNHAMVKIIDKENKVYWIDPTNFASMATGIFPDIANKSVLVLDAKTPKYEKIPAVNYAQAVETIKREWYILEDNTIVENGELNFQNEIALDLAGITLRFSPELIKDAIFDSLAGKHLDKEDKRYMLLPNLDSRIVQDLSFKYSFLRKNQILSTNVGLALRLTYDGGAIARLWDVTKDNIADILIENMPITVKKQTVIKDVDVPNVEFLNREVKTPWIYIKRECNLQNHDLQIDDTLIIYKNIIPNTDLKKITFLKLKNWLEKHFKDVIVVFKAKKSR